MSSQTGMAQGCAPDVLCICKHCGSLLIAQTVQVAVTALQLVCGRPEPEQRLLICSRVRSGRASLCSCPSHATEHRRLSEQDACPAAATAADAADAAAGTAAADAALLRVVCPFWTVPN